MPYQGLCKVFAARPWCTLVNKFVQNRMRGWFGERRVGVGIARAQNRNVKEIKP